MEPTPEQRCETIFRATVDAMRREYASSESARKRHLKARLKECYRRHAKIAVERFAQANPDGIPVLIGKHFTFSLLNCAAKYGIDPTEYLDLCIGNNPEPSKPGSPFMREWGGALHAMEAEFADIATRLSGSTGADDYIIWVHEKQEARGGQDCSIYGPDEIIQAGDNWALLMQITRQRIAELTKP